jgi:hypothetical protein
MDIGCALDEKGFAEQRDRYRRLAASVVDLRRDGDRLVVDFAADLDRGLLAGLLAVEKECCPFFELGFDDEARRLEVGVDDPKLADALDAVADQLA